MLLRTRSSRLASYPLFGTSHREVEQGGNCIVAPPSHLSVVIRTPDKVACLEYPMAAVRTFDHRVRVYAPPPFSFDIWNSGNTQRHTLDWPDSPFSTAPKQTFEVRRFEMRNAPRISISWLWRGQICARLPDGPRCVTRHQHVVCRWGWLACLRRHHRLPLA